MPVLGGLLGVVALSPLVSGAGAPAAWSAGDPAAALRVAAEDTAEPGRTGARIGDRAGDRAGARHRHGRAAVRVAAYRGVRIPVPEGWEVHDLDRDPTRCVRFDRRAIYLGRQGDRPDCPSRVIGGEDALHVEPLGPPPRVRGPEPSPSRDGARRTGRPDRSAALARYTVAPSVDHRVRVPLREAGVVISGMYGKDPSQVQRVIRSATIAPARPARGDDRDEDEDDRDDRDKYHYDRDYRPKHKHPKHPSGLPFFDLGPFGGDDEPRSTAPPKPKPKAEPKPKPKAKPKSKPKAKPKKNPPSGRQQNWTVGKGFDTCTAPSLASMRAWRGAFKVSNIYIGGAARGCAQPRLNRAWVKSVRSMGYRLVPTYVGLQAPCGRYRTRFTAGNAAAEGRRAATDAVREAKALGIPHSKPIYFDMEAYRQDDASCREAVLTFLHHWTKQMKVHRYVPGVYGSVGSVVRDLVLSKGFTRPSALWFAHWDGIPRLYGHPHIPDAMWHPHRRIKQYRGGHKETHGGVTINIDSNHVDGRVY
nr:hypothetical protein GCM10010200_070830 [Actinomadura rugatobispora]